MDFIEFLNESFGLRFEEVSETGESTFILQDIDNDIWYRFYTVDIYRILGFLNHITKFPNDEINATINESFELRYYGIKNSEEPAIILKDLDSKEDINFYSEDVKNIKRFLNRLQTFGVLK